MNNHITTTPSSSEVVTSAIACITALHLPEEPSFFERVAFANAAQVLLTATYDALLLTGEDAAAEWAAEIETTYAEEMADMVREGTDLHSTRESILAALQDLKGACDEVAADQA